MIYSISKDIDKKIRSDIFPELKENGFILTKGRTAWGWHDECIWVFNISSVGNYHSSITNWPSASITVNLGIYYTYLPKIYELKRDDKDLLYPKENECHRRGILTCSYDQSKYTKQANCNTSEKNRRDIWWIQPDGSNITEVINDIHKCCLKYAVKWFLEKSNKEQTLLDAYNLYSYHIEDIENMKYIF
jgi:hypothetical protein